MSEPWTSRKVWELLDEGGGDLVADTFNSEKLRLLEALRIARRFMPNSRCPTPCEEKAYSVVDAALAAWEGAQQ